MNNLKCGLQLAYFYTSAIIGAGFISGRETMENFARHDTFGFYGILIASVVMGVTGTFLMLLTLKYKSMSYPSFINTVFGKYFGFFVKCIAFAFMLVIFSAMTSGAGEIFSQIFPLGKIIPKIFFLFLCFVTVIGKPRFICSISSLLCPIMVIGIIFICTVLIINLPHMYKFQSPKPTAAAFPISALCWCSYNIITLPSVIFGIKSAVKTKEASVIGGILSSILIFICAVSIFFTETLFYERISDSPIPLAFLCAAAGKPTEYIYMLIFLCAVFTTAISLLNAISSEIANIFRMNTNTSLLYVCIFGFLFSFFGFSEIVGTFYKIFGFAGILIPVVIFLHINPFRS